MLCSVPAGKSSSNWLDRLRSTKGFPTSSGVDLGHFLANPENPNPSTPSPATDPAASETAQPSRQRVVSQNLVRDGQSGKEWYGIMTNVLSELFIMGDPCPNPGKKSSRKQRNPRFCPSSSDCVRKDNTAPVATLSVNSDSNSMEKAENGDNAGLDDAEDEKEELIGYSRSEVTVIDTSCAEWKFEKLLFRRKNVWKVRDRKGKSRGGLGRKKRKASGCDDAIVHGKRKHKVSASELDSLNEGMYTLNGRRDVCKKIADNPSQDPKMRFPSSGSPAKLKKGSSSVVLIKGIPTGKKKLNLLKSRMKQ